MPHETPSSSMSERKVLAAVPIAQLVFGLSQGIEPERLCKQAGLSVSDLHDRDRFVPHTWKWALWDALSELCPQLAVGVAFGKFITPDHLGYLGQVFRHSSHGLDLLQKLIRFGSLFDSESSRQQVNIEVTHDSVRALTVPSPHEQYNRLECVEATLIGVVVQLRAVSEAEVRVLEVHTHQTDQRNRAAYEEIFDCPLYFGSSREGLVFARESMQAPLRGANTEVAQRIEAYVAEAFADGPDASLVAKVQSVVRQQLRAGELSQRAAAHALGLGVRALERRLKSCGTSFGVIAEDARRSEAQRLLREQDLAIYEIAFCLGYQDVSSFNRAFKRWFGVAPSAYRAGSTS